MSEGDFIQKNFHQHGSSAQKSWTAKKKSVNADVNHSVYIQPQGSDLFGRKKTQTMSGVAQYGLHQCKNENAKSSKYVNRHIFNTALLDRRDSNDGSTAHVQSNDAIDRVSKSTGINLSNVTISEHDKE